MDVCILHLRTYIKYLLSYNSYEAAAWSGSETDADDNISYIYNGTWILV